MRSFGGFWRAWLGEVGRGRSGGACGLVGEAREARWPWWQWTAATSSARWLRARNRGGGRSEESERRFGGVAWHRLEPSRASRQAGGGRARAGVPRPRALSIGAGRKTTGEGLGGLGRPLGPPGGCTGELAQISFCSLFSELFLFSIFL